MTIYHQGTKGKKGSDDRPHNDVLPFMQLRVLPAFVVTTAEIYRGRIQRNTMTTVLSIGAPISPRRRPHPVVERPQR
jgi:hypothetical protein